MQQNSFALQLDTAEKPLGNRKPNADAGRSIMAYYIVDGIAFRSRAEAVAYKSGK